MKVNTDGILLGAWAQVTDKRRILDIGTGSGLIALMLAQRTQNSLAKITALDLDADAAVQAKENAQCSPWADRIDVIQQDILTFSPADHDHDLLVCNPPYFIESLTCPDPKRSMARHTDNLDFNNLFNKAASLASKRAEFCLILPIEHSNSVVELGANTGWHLIEACSVAHDAKRVPIRVLLRFANNTPKTPTYSSHITIRNEDRSYSDAFTQLCRDFYLKM